MHQHQTTKRPIQDTPKLTQEPSPININDVQFTRPPPPLPIGYKPFMQQAQKTTEPVNKPCRKDENNNLTESKQELQTMIAAQNTQRQNNTRARKRQRPTPINDRFANRTCSDTPASNAKVLNTQRHTAKKHEPCYGKIKSCPYLFCDPKSGKPIYEWPNLKRCGYNTCDPETHPICHDNRLLCALGTPGLLKYQRKYIKDGCKPKHRPPLINCHYDKKKNLKVHIAASTEHQHYQPIPTRIDYENNQVETTLCPTGTSTTKPRRDFKSPIPNSPTVTDSIKHLAKAVSEKISDMPTDRPPYLRHYCSPRMIDRRNNTFTWNNFFLLLTILLYTTLLTMPRGAQATTITDFHQKNALRNNYVYEFITNSNINNHYVFLSRTYRQCDIKLIHKDAKRLIQLHEDICHTKTRPAPQENPNKIEKENDHYYLLEGEYNRFEAQQRCEAQGSFLAEITNKEEEQNLKSFMGQHHVEEAYAGIYMERLLGEGLFISSKKVATYKMFHTLQYNYWTKQDSPTSADWQVLIDRHHENDYYGRGAYFVYQHQGTEIVLKAIFEMNKKNKGPHLFWGKARLSRAICQKTPKSPHTHLDTTTWKASCLDTNAKLKQDIINMETQINEMSPQHLPQIREIIEPHMSLRPDQYKIKTKRDAHSTSNAQVDFEKYIEQTDEEPTEQECNAYIKFDKSPEPNEINLKTDNNSRTGRNILAPLAVASTFGSIIGLYSHITDWIADPDDDLLRSTQQSHEVREEELFRQLHKNYENAHWIKTLIKQTNEFAKLANERQEIESTIAQYVTYTHRAHTKLMRLVHQNDAPSVLDFLTLTNLHQIRDEMRNRKHVELTSSLRQIKTQLTVTKASIVINFYIPIVTKQTEMSIYKIHALPVYANNTKSTPNLPYNYVAYNRHEDNYIPMEPMDTMECIERSICTSPHPTYTRHHIICGINDYFNTSSVTKCKQWTHEKSLEPTFLVIGNTSYYSTNPKKPLTITTICQYHQYSRMNTNTTKAIQGTGYFTIKSYCIAKHNQTTLIPAIRNLRRYPKAFDIAFWNHETTIPINVFDTIVDNLPQDNISQFIQKYAYKAIALAILSLLLLPALTVAVYCLCKKLNPLRCITCCNPFRRTNAHSMNTTNGRNTLRKHIGQESPQEEIEMQTLTSSYDTCGQRSFPQTATYPTQPTGPNNAATPPNVTEPQIRLPSQTPQLTEANKKLDKQMTPDNHNRRHETIVVSENLHDKNARKRQKIHQDVTSPIHKSKTTTFSNSPAPTFTTTPL